MRGTASLPPAAPRPPYDYHTVNRPPRRRAGKPE